MTENIIPDWVWKRRYSARFNRVATIALGLLFGAFGLAIIVAVFYARSDIESVCTTYLSCANLITPGTPLGNALNLLDVVTVPAAGTAAGGLAYALGALRARPSESAAALGVQPFAKRLQLWYSQGKLTKQQAEELFADLTASIRR